MIDRVVADWHRFTKGNLPGGLEQLLADDCVFHSPVVLTPQVGKAKSKAYLLGACLAFGGRITDPVAGTGILGDGFRYVREILSGQSAMLEFECAVDGKQVNGVDLITCNDRGQIVDFKVMLRPLQAVNAVHARMGEILAAMKAAG